MENNKTINQASHLANPPRFQAVHEKISARCRIIPISRAISKTGPILREIHSGRIKAIVVSRPIIIATVSRVE